MVDVFNCHKCGSCCKNFGEHNQPPEEVPCFTGGDDPRKICISKNFKLLLLKEEVELFPPEHVVPFSCVFDVKNMRTIILDYTMNTEPCPLLDQNNECTKYSQRPLTCRWYPCVWCDAIDFMNKDLSVAFGGCKTDLSREELIKQFGFRKDGDEYKLEAYKVEKCLYERYGDSFLSAKILDNIYKRYALFLRTLDSKNAVDIAFKGYDDPKQLNDYIKKSSKIDVSDLFKTCNGFSLYEDATSDEKKKEFISKIKED